jgi:hypothetical protein
MRRILNSRIWITIALALTAIVNIEATACRTSNPIATAATATPENRAETVAFALHNSYVVIAEQVATVVEDTLTPPAVKKALITAHRSASPVVKKLRTAAEYYGRLREQVALGTGDPEKLKLALDELNRLITEAAPKIDSVATAISRSHS